MSSKPAGPSSSNAPPPARPVCLALQGGGSHGAFTWGVLDGLLEDTRLEITGLSGASAGAVNAVAVAHGFAVGAPGPAERRQLARDTLARIWRAVADMGSVGVIAQKMARMVTGGWGQEAAGQVLGNAMSRWMSPYQANPLDINPLRRLLDGTIDFEAVARLATPRIFVSATQVRTGRAEIFQGRRLDLAAVMASACLPQMFQAVEIDGEHYWDGGFSSNPPLGPLIDECGTQDIVLVQLNPLSRESLPQSSQEIAERINELTFNASLLSQMRGIDTVNRLIAQGALADGGAYRSMRLHRIDGGRSVQDLSASSKLSADGSMMERLFDDGRAAAQDWLARHFGDLGVRSTIDIRRDYLGGAAPRD